MKDNIWSILVIGILSCETFNLANSYSLFIFSMKFKFEFIHMT